MTKCNLTVEVTNRVQSKVMEINRRRIQTTSSIQEKSMLNSYLMIMRKIKITGLTRMPEMIM